MKYNKFARNRQTIFDVDVEYKKLTKNVYSVNQVGKKRKYIVKVYKDKCDMISECNRLEILKDVPNIPKLYTRGYDKYFHYSIMSKCPGGSLDSFLTNFKFTDQELKNVIRQILEIVKAIHDKGVVHGDLKTSNIMFNLKTRKISIIDFEKHKYSSDYRSPEHIMDCKTTVKNDCWAIGVIMYELFHEDICFDSKKEILKKEPEISDDMSELAKDLLVKLLDKDPNTRISIDEALNHSWFTQ